MTDFGSVQTSPHQPDSFALHYGPAGPADRWVVPFHAHQFGHPLPYDFRHSARRVLQVLPGLLYLTAYPSPLKSIARMLSQRQMISRWTGCSGSPSQRPESGLASDKGLRNPFYDQRGRSSSMTHFNDKAQILIQALIALTSFQYVHTLFGPP